MNTLDINVNSNVKQNPVYPDGYYLCKDEDGMYIASRNKQKWSYVHSANCTGGKIDTVCGSSIQREILARLNFIDT